MRRIVDKYHEAAKEKGVRIVHCCGFDSIPSDLGTCLVVDHLSRLGKYVLHALDWFIALHELQSPAEQQICLSATQLSLACMRC